jgi:hypothetical protein
MRMTLVVSVMAGESVMEFPDGSGSGLAQSYLSLIEFIWMLSCKT